jgi:uncharacterized protein (DUF1778 family)
MESKLVRITFRIKDAAYAMLKEEAARQHRSVAGMVKHIIIQWFETSREEKKGKGCEN